MGDLFSYSLSDFVSYSAESLFAMTADLNGAVFPVYAFIGLLLFCMAYLGSRNSHYFIPAALFCHALMSVLVGVVYFHCFYMHLDWAGRYYAWLFYGLAAGLMIAAVAQFFSTARVTSQPASFWLGKLYLVAAVFIIPLLGWFDGRTLQETAVIGVTPHATIISVTGILLLADNRWLKFLLIGPLLWAGVTVISSWPMELLQGQVVLPMVLLAILISLFHKSNRHSQLIQY